MPVNYSTDPSSSSSSKPPLNDLKKDKEPQKPSQNEIPSVGKIANNIQMYKMAYSLYIKKLQLNTKQRIIEAQYKYSKAVDKFLNDFHVRKTAFEVTSKEFIQEKKDSLKHIEKFRSNANNFLMETKSKYITVLNTFLNDIPNKKSAFQEKTVEFMKIKKDEVEKLRFNAHNLITEGKIKYYTIAVKFVKDIRGKMSAFDVISMEVFEKHAVTLLKDKKDSSKPFPKSSIKLPSHIPVPALPLESIGRLRRLLETILKRLPIRGKRLLDSGKMSSPSGSAAPSRPMKYPYTYTAKIVQFPLKYYIKNNWMWKYYLIAVGVSFPLFYKLHKLSSTPENVKKWEEIRKRDFSGAHH